MTDSDIFSEATIFSEDEKCLNALIRDYLVYMCCDKTYHSFCTSTFSTASNKNIGFRKKIKTLILSGSSIEALNVIEQNGCMTAEIKDVLTKNVFIEYVKNKEYAKALAFVRAKIKDPEFEYDHGVYSMIGYKITGEKQDTLEKIAERVNKELYIAETNRERPMLIDLLEHYEILKEKYAKHLAKGEGDAEEKQFCSNDE